MTGFGSAVTAIAAGFFNSCAVTTAGGVLCWGNNAYGQAILTGGATVIRAVDVAELRAAATAI